VSRALPVENASWATWWLLGALCALSAPHPAQAQAVVDPEERATEQVAAVVVEGAVSSNSADSARAIFGVEVGDELDREKIRQGIRRVFLTGPWADVRVYTEPAAGGVRVTLRLIPDRVVVDVQVTTRGQLPADVLREAVQLSPGDRFREDRLLLAADAITRRCRDLGYPRAEVRTHTEVQSKAELKVIFDVSEGIPTRVRQLTVTGPAVISRPEIEDLLGVGEGAPFNRLALDEGLKRVREFLVSRRYLRAEARVLTVDYTGGGERADLTVEVDPGPRYRIAFTGNRQVAEAYLADKMNERKLGAIDEQSLAKGRRVVERFYKESGFALVKVRTDDVPAYAPYTKSADRLLRFVIEEGPRVEVAEIYIEGAQSKAPTELVDDIWSFVRSEVPRTTLLQRIYQADLDAVLGATSGKDHRHDPVEQSDEYFGIFPDFGPAKEPVFLVGLFEGAAQRLTDLYQTDGFLEARVYGPEPMFIDGGTRVRVRYRIEEGPQVILSGVRFTPEPTLPLEELLSVATFEPGQPANLYEIEETRVVLERTLKERGFPFARVTESLERRANPGEADVLFTLDEGPRVRVGSIRIVGSSRTRDFVVLDRLTLKRGDWLEASKVEASRQRLLRMGLFSSVSIDVAATSENRTVRDLVVRVRERPLFAIETGLGASVEDGPRVFLAGELRNPFGLGIGVRGRGQVNYPWLTYNLVYREDDPNHPNVRAAKQLPQAPLLYHFEGQALGVIELPKVYGVPFDTRFHIDGVGLREIRPAFTLMRASVLAGLEASPFSWWRSAFELEGEVSDFDCPEDNLDFGLGCGQGSIGLTRRRDAGFIQQATARIRLVLDFRDDAFQPHKGVFIGFDNEVAVGSGVLRTDATSAEPERVNSDFFKTSLVASGYIPLADRFTLALSFRGGNIFPIVTEDNYVPLFKRFYLGGTSSIRGFYPDEILPADHPNWPADQFDPDPGAEELREARNSLGGNFFVNARAELRVGLIGDLDLGIFLDGGELLGDVRNVQLAGFAAGTGVGFRYNTPVGPFAVDLGFRILDGQRRQPPLLSFERMNLHFSIGYF
jgi:outer membrane protein insertion porin family